MQSLTALLSTSRSRRWFSKSPAGPTSSSSPASEPPSRPPWPPRSSLNFFPCRSAAYIKMGQFTKAHQDAVKAKELNSEWPKVWQYKRWCWACLSIRIIVVLSERTPGILGIISLWKIHIHSQRLFCWQQRWGNPSYGVWGGYFTSAAFTCSLLLH